MSNMNNAIELYVTGVPASQVLKQFPVDPSDFYKTLRERGLKTSGSRPPRCMRPFDWDQIRDSYIRGSSMPTIAAKAGVSRGTAAKWLTQDGIELRTASEAERLKWLHMPEDVRKAQVSAAHAARRNQKAGTEELNNRSKGIQSRGMHGSIGERQIATALNEAGFECTPQFSVGKYNVDIAVTSHSIAVELFTGNWHATGRHAARHFDRCKDILSSGMDMLIVWSVRNHALAPAKVSKAVVTMIDAVRRNDTSRCRYQVILGDGQPAPASRFYFNDSAFIESLGCRETPGK